MVFDAERWRLQYRSNLSWQSRLKTWFSILEVLKNQESSFEARVLSFEDRESRIVVRVSRHSKNFLRISNRDFEETIKQNNSDKQSNWHAALFTQTAAEIIRKCMSIDISFSFTYHTEREAMQLVTRDLEIS